MPVAEKSFEVGNRTKRRPLSQVKEWEKGGKTEKLTSKFYRNEKDNNSIIPVHRNGCNQRS